MTLVAMKLKPTRMLKRKVRVNGGLVCMTSRHRSEELARLSLMFRETVDRLSEVMNERDAAHAEALRAEGDKKRFYRDVLCAVTNGRFALVEREEVPDRGEVVAELPVYTARDYAGARRAITSAACEVSMPEERSDDLLIAAGEAIANAMKHGRDAAFTLYRSADALTIRLADHGAGIRVGDLPSVVLVSGFSTKHSLGMGYTLMLQLCDCMWLSTGPEGTVVQIEKKIREPESRETFPQELLHRFNGFHAPAPTQ